MVETYRPGLCLFVGRVLAAASSPAGELLSGRMGGGAYHYHRYHPPHGLSSYPSPTFGVDHVRTLFVAGLPDDVKPRELHNLFTDFPGFLSSKLNLSSQGIGFVVFSDQPSALAALRAINGMVFDLEQDSTLHVDLAKSNSRPKRARTTDIAGQWDKKLRGVDATPKALLDRDMGGYDHTPGMQNTGHTYPSFQSLGSTGHQGDDSFDSIGSLVNSSLSYIPQNIVPCSTLFVTNLGPQCTESELTQIFARCPGFLKLKMQHKQNGPVAFVDFKDISASSEALNSQQGRLLRSSVGLGLCLEYAKSRMGLKKRERTR